MDLKRLRPKDVTSTAIRASLAAIAAEQANATSRVEAAADVRRKVLTTGTVAQIREAESAAAEARLDLEQLAELARAFSDDLEAALAIEAAEALKTRADAALADAAAKMTEWSNWWSQYPALLAAIAAGIRMQDEAIAATVAAGNACRAAGRSAALASLPVEVGPVWGTADRSGNFDVVRLGSLVQLPRPAIDSSLCIWPPTLLGRETPVHHTRL